MMDDTAYNVMFIGTSFMGIYNVGSAQCLLDHGKGVIQKIKSVGGTSAGAIAACLLLSSPERLLHFRETIFQLSQHIHGMDKGASTSGYDIIGHVRSILQDYLKPDAHITCSGRVSVPITELIPAKYEDTSKAHKKKPGSLSPRGSPRGAPTTVEMGGKTWTFGSRVVVTTFNTRDELIEVLLCSTYVPWFADWKPPQFRNRYYVDGSIGRSSIGVGDMDFPPGRLITVSPDKKAAHQKPQDNITTQWRDVSDESFQLQPFNMFRVGDALYPPPETQLKQSYQEGAEDAKEFLMRFKVYESGMDSLRSGGPIM